MYPHADEKETRERAARKPPPSAFPPPHQKLDKFICNRLDEFHRHPPMVFSKELHLSVDQVYSFPRVLNDLSGEGSSKVRSKGRYDESI
jgi:hypothetical protein